MLIYVFRVSWWSGVPWFGVLVGILVERLVHVWGPNWATEGRVSQMSLRWHVRATSKASSLQCQRCIFVILANQILTVPMVQYGGQIRTPTSIRGRNLIISSWASWGVLKLIDFGLASQTWVKSTWSISETWIWWLFDKDPSTMSTVRRLLFPSKVLSEISSHQGLAQKYGREPPRKPTRYSYPNAPGSSRRFLTLGFTDWWRPCRGFPARLKFVSGATDFQNFQCFQHPNLSLRAKLLGKNRDGRFSVWGKVGKGNHPFEVSRLHCQIWSEMPCLKPLVPTWLNAKDLEVGKAAAKTTIERDLLPLASSFARHVTKTTACGWRLLQLWFEKTGVMKGIEGFPNKTQNMVKLCGNYQESRGNLWCSQAPEQLKPVTVPNPAVDVWAIGLLAWIGGSL